MLRIMVLILYTGIALSIVLCGVSAWIHYSTSSFIISRIDDLPKSEAVLVLGARTYESGTLSPLYKDRVDMAMNVYKSEKAHVILVSGDNGTTTYNEVNPVRMYLLEKGVPDSDIFLDHAGFDTYSSMYRARDVFKVSSLIIATQSFHLPRAVFLARHLGIDAYGIVSDKRGSRLKNYVREFLANIKALLDLTFHREPKYLGDEIPVMETTQDKT